jgi:hypothetical protein
MLSFRQFVTEQLKKRTFRNYFDGGKKSRIYGVEFSQRHDISGIPVDVAFTRRHYVDVDDRHDKEKMTAARAQNRKAYIATFEVGNSFTSPARESPKTYQTDPHYLKVAALSPKIMKTVKDAIEKFVVEKKPRVINLAPNEASKIPVYRAYANYLARKYGGEVKEASSPYSIHPEFNVYLPGKK